MSIYDFARRLALLSLAWAGAATGAELPAWIVAVPDSIETILVADTSDATLYEYSFGSDGSFAVTEYYMSIGQRGAGKTRAGDQKTPLGNYFIVDQLDTSRLDPKYGVTAFPLDYPNVLDRLAGRTGDGIWLHGVLPGDERRPERDTDGCIALPNEDLAELSTRLVLKQTPVLVTSEMRFAAPAETEATRSSLLAHLEAWRRAVAEGDTIDYLAMYGPDFRYRGLDRDEWAAFRAAELDDSQDLEISDVLVLLDAEDPGLALTRFTVSLADDAGATALTKRLYWRRSDGDRWLIVAEDNG